MFWPSEISDDYNYAVERVNQHVYFVVSSPRDSSSPFEAFARAPPTPTFGCPVQTSDQGSEDSALGRNEHTCGSKEAGNELCPLLVAALDFPSYAVYVWLRF